MLIIDWVIVVLWLLGTLKGWSRGLVRQAVSIFAIVLGFLLAKAFCSVLGTSLAPESEHPALVNGVCFVLIWLIVPIAFGLVGELVSTVLDKLCILGTINKMGGALIGFLKYGFVLGALVWVLSAVDIIGKETLQQSVFCSPLREIPVGVYRLLTSDGGVF